MGFFDFFKRKKTTDVVEEPKEVAPIYDGDLEDEEVEVEEVIVPEEVDEPVETEEIIDAEEVVDPEDEDTVELEPEETVEPEDEETVEPETVDEFPYKTTYANSTYEEGVDFVGFKYDGNFNITAKDGIIFVKSRVPFETGTTLDDVDRTNEEVPMVKTEDECYYIRRREGQRPRVLRKY